MKKIVMLVQPFVLNQTVYVYENNNKIDMFQVLNEDCAEELCKYSVANDVEEIDLTGAKKYAQGIQKAIEKEIATKYSYDKLTVKII